MNPEEVKNWYFQVLKEMLESENPQDRRTALAELGKIYRSEINEETPQYAWVGGEARFYNSLCEFCYGFGADATWELYEVKEESEKEIMLKKTLPMGKSCVTTIIHPIK